MTKKTLIYSTHLLSVCWVPGEGNRTRPPFIWNLVSEERQVEQKGLVICNYNSNECNNQKDKGFLGEWNTWWIILLASPVLPCVTVSNFSCYWTRCCLRGRKTSLLRSFPPSLIIHQPWGHMHPGRNASPAGSLQNHRGYNWDDYEVIAPLPAGTALVKGIMKFWWVPERTGISTISAGLHLASGWGHWD